MSIIAILIHPGAGNLGGGSTRLFRLLTLGGFLKHETPRIVIDRPWSEFEPFSAG